MALQLGLGGVRTVSWVMLGTLCSNDQGSFSPFPQHLLVTTPCHISWDTVWLRHKHSLPWALEPAKKSRTLRCSHCDTQMSPGTESHQWHQSHMPILASAGISSFFQVFDPKRSLSLLIAGLSASGSSLPPPSHSSSGSDEAHWLQSSSEEPPLHPAPGLVSGCFQTPYVHRKSSRAGFCSESGRLFPPHLPALWPLGPKRAALFRGSQISQKNSSL